MKRLSMLSLFALVAIAALVLAATPPDLRFQNAVGDNTGRITGATFGAAGHTDNGVFNNIDILTITAPDNVLSGAKTQDNSITPEKLRRGATAPAAGLVYWGDGRWEAPNASELAQFRNLKITTTGALDNQSVLLTADRIVMAADNNDPVIRSSVSLTIDLGNSGAGGLDNGSLGANIGYYIYAIDNGAVAGLASTSATAPVMPATYTRKALLGWLTTDNTATPFNIEEFTQTNERYKWGVPAKVVAAGGSTTTAAVNLSKTGLSTFDVVPANLTVEVQGKVHCLAYIGNTAWYADPTTFPSPSPTDGTDIAFFHLPNNNNSTTMGTFALPLLESQTFYHQTTAAFTVDIYVTGFTLKR